MYTVYSKDNCPACKIAVSMLEKSNSDFKVIKVVESANDENEISKMDFISKFPGVRVVPYIIGPNEEVYKTYVELNNHLSK